MAWQAQVQGKYLFIVKESNINELQLQYFLIERTNFFAIALFE